MSMCTGNDRYRGKEEGWEGGSCIGTHGNRNRKRVLHECNSDHMYDGQQLRTYMKHTRLCF